MNLPDDNTDEVIAKCKWQELPTTELTDEAKERAKETKGLLEAYKKADKSEQTRFY